LENLVEYAREVHHRGPLTTDLALDWAQVPPLANSPQRVRRLGAVRRFAIFWAAFDPRTQIPPAGVFGPDYRRVPVHIYTPQEIAALLRAAQQLPPPESLRPLTFSTLLGLLACTGLRDSEALELQLADWDRAEAVLTIRQAKFGQSRCVPLAPSAAIALNAYLMARARAFPKDSSGALFLNAAGKPLTYGQAAHTFAALREQLNWQHKEPRPRLHDLRQNAECREMPSEVNQTVRNLRRPP
jgi:integrase